MIGMSKQSLGRQLVVEESSGTLAATVNGQIGRVSKYAADLHII